MSILKEGKSRSGLWVCQRGGKDTMQYELLDMITMASGKIATAEPNVDLVYSVGVDDGERTSASLWACTCVSGLVAELNLLSESSQGTPPEEGTCPFLRHVSRIKTSEH